MVLAVVISVQLGYIGEYEPWVGCSIRVPVETECNETVTETYNFVFRVAEPCDLD